MSWFLYLLVFFCCLFEYESLRRTRNQFVMKLNYFFLTKNNTSQFHRFSNLQTQFHQLFANNCHQKKVVQVNMRMCATYYILFGRISEIYIYFGMKIVLCFIGPFHILLICYASKRFISLCDVFIRSISELTNLTNRDWVFYVLSFCFNCFSICR